MKAFKYYGPGDGRIEELDVPQLQSGEVLVKVRACGICATDIKTLKRGHPKIKPGTVLGHEIAGEIVAVKDVSEWREGQAVIVPPYAPCGICRYCERGKFTLCENLFSEALDPGGFSEYVRVPPRLVQKGMVALPADGVFTEASLAEPLACCIHGLEVLDLHPMDTLLIVGDGPMGLMQAELARLARVSRIVLVGSTPARLSFAEKLADVVVDVNSQNVHEAVKAAVPEGIDKMLISVGLTEVAQDMLALAGKGAVINLYAGLPGGSQLTVDAGQIHYEGVILLGSFGFAPSHFARAVELIAGGSVRMGDFITDTITIEHITEAIQAAAGYHGIKSVVTFA